MRRLWATNSLEFASEGALVGIGVPSGRSETVRTGLGSGNCNAIGGGALTGGATNGVLVVAATGVALAAPSVG